LWLEVESDACLRFDEHGLGHSVQTEFLFLTAEAVLFARLADREGILPLLLRPVSLPEVGLLVDPVLELVVALEARGSVESGGVAMRPHDITIG